MSARSDCGRTCLLHKNVQRDERAEVRGRVWRTRDRWVDLKHHIETPRKAMGVAWMTSGLGRGMQLCL